MLLVLQLCAKCKSSRGMRIAFVDLAAWDYSINAPASVPLGGSQSALCYLAKELARLGHEVTLVNRTTLTGISDGVTYCPVTSVAAAKNSPNVTWLSCKTQPGRQPKSEPNWPQALD